MAQEHLTLYIIWLYLEKETNITIGKKGSFSFPKGDYLYIGSAKRGLSQRLKRHYRLDKKKRWHIDYFRAHALWRKKWTFHERTGECALRRFTADMLNAEYPLRGFGSSDCRCPAHLLKVPEMSKTTGNRLSKRWHK